jgi:hypothetical protein
MDLKQSKLTKTEWNNTEIPVNPNEKFILDVIMNGFNDVNIRLNMNKSMFQMVKIEYTPENEYYLFQKYFCDNIKNLHKKYTNSLQYNYVKTKNVKSPKKSDMMRINNMDALLMNKKSEIFEFVMIEYCKRILKSLHNGTDDFVICLYTLVHLTKSSIINVNKYVMEYIHSTIKELLQSTKIRQIIHNAYDFIEKNSALLKYEDITLFQHQKELFSLFKSPDPKLVLYIAPTGTGKTLSPIGLSQKYRVIFICVSRHVGLALAKSAISMQKKIAFAFGCETASDIRLHYFAASIYETNYRSGGVGKVDNSVGDKVEIMICDVQSYLTAMYYMLSFNDETEIVTYWDEPTITMDYESHELHEQIHKNWCNNKISKMVLSCATLPKEDEIQETIMDFKCKFDCATVHTICSFDFKKSISIIDSDNYCVVPHLRYSDYEELTKCARYCDDNKTLLRYFDLQEIIHFVLYVNDYKLINGDYMMEKYFGSIHEINMNSVKLYYLKLLLQLKDETMWKKIHEDLKSRQKRKFQDFAEKPLKRLHSNNDILQTDRVESVFKKQNSLDSLSKTNTQSSGILLTTQDAHTLTDGPTIFMADDVKKIAKFYVKMANIPSSVLTSLSSKLSVNNSIQVKMEKLEQKIDDRMNALNTEDKDRKADRKEAKDPELRRLNIELDGLRSKLQPVELDNVFIPNTPEHQTFWTKQIQEGPYKPDIEDDIVRKIMELGVCDTYKILLLLGIGTFDNTIDAKYIEIMKELAYNQKLYIIIASTDYVYGTNYSFCHGYIGKDLCEMTQQKILQAMGRIGRNKAQRDYTIRFRNNDLIDKLFHPMMNNLEAINMSKLFNS